MQHPTLVLSYLLCIISCFCWAQEPHVCLSNLKNEAQRIMSKLPRSHFGVLELYNFNGHILFTPASNNKVLTCAATLLEFGTDYQFSTLFFGDGSNLCIQPRADPSLSMQALQSALSQNVCETFACNQVNNIIIDTSFYPSSTRTDMFDYPASWEVEDLSADYGAKPVAAMLDENTAAVTVRPGAELGTNNFHFDTAIPISCSYCETLPASSQQPQLSVYVSAAGALKVVGSMPINAAAVTSTFAVLDPVQYMGKSIASLIRVPSATVQTGSCSQTLRYVLKSAPLSQLMNFTLQVSDNLHAETFAKLMGIGSNVDLVDETRAGVLRIKHVLTEKLQVSNTSFVQFDGSGVSPKNLISPEALVSTLSGIQKFDQRLAYAFRTMLPKAGISGSLKNRFKQYPGILEAKTGTISGVNTLSGYIHAKYIADGLVFSIMVNHSQEPSSIVRQVIDELALAFAFTDPNC